MGRYDALLHPSEPVVTSRNIASEKARKPASPQNHLPASPKTGSLPPQQTLKPAVEYVEKYTTRLKPSLIKRIKIYAAEQDCDDYEVVTQAVEEFLSKK